MVVFGNRMWRRYGVNIGWVWAVWWVYLAHKVGGRGIDVGQAGGKP